jgi:multiple sugar transport system ATP-binding protein
MNVRENMGFALKLAKMDKREIKERVEEAANLLGIGSLLDRKPGELSGGQRQRVALGRSIVRNPTVFLFDEPLSNLDAKLRIQMRGEIIKLQRKLKITQVYVTHDQVEAMSMADRIAILNDGKFQQVGTPSDVYNRPANQFVAGFIGSPSMNFFEAKFESEEVIFGDQKFSLSSEIASKVKEGQPNEVILGIRPEHIKISPERFENTYEVKVTVVEFLGAETIVTFEFPDGLTGMVSAPGFYNAKMGDTAYIAFPMEKIHIFDKATRNNLVHQSAEKKIDKPTSSKGMVAKKQESAPE